MLQNDLIYIPNKIDPWVRLVIGDSDVGDLKL